jgi:hypothetical protein
MTNAAQPAEPHRIGPRWHSAKGLHAALPTPRMRRRTRSVPSPGRFEPTIGAAGAEDRTRLRSHAIDPRKHEERTPPPARSAPVSLPLSPCLDLFGLFRFAALSSAGWNALHRARSRAWTWASLHIVAVGSSSSCILVCMSFGTIGWLPAPRPQSCLSAPTRGP